MNEEGVASWQRLLSCPAGFQSRAFGDGTEPLPFPSSISPPVNGYTVPAEVDMRNLHPGKPGLQELLASKVPMESNAYRCSAGAYISMETTDDAVSGRSGCTKVPPRTECAFVGESLFQNGNYVSAVFSEWRKDDPAYQPGTARYFRFTLYTNAGETTAKGPYAVKFLPPFVLTEPAHNAEGTAKTPTFRWQSFGLADAHCSITMYAFSGGTMQNAGYANLSGDVSETAYGNSNWAWNGPISNPLPGSTRCHWYGYLWQVITTDGLTSYAHCYSYPHESTTQP